SAGTLYQGDGAVLNNFGSLALTGDNSTNFYYGGTRLVLNNSGTLAKTAGSGVSNIDATFNNSGTVRSSAGTLAFGSNFTNTGTLNAAGGNFSSANPLDVGTGKISGTGTFTAPSVTVGGVIAPGNSAGLLTIAGSLTLQGTATSQFEVG